MQRPGCMGRVACVLAWHGRLIALLSINTYLLACSWLIAIAYWLAGGFIKSGLGNRIAYAIVSAFGKTSLGLTYSLVGGAREQVMQGQFSGGGYCKGKRPCWASSTPWWVAGAEEVVWDARPGWVKAGCCPTRWYSCAAPHAPHLLERAGVC